jgi:hypothetical protein
LAGNSVQKSATGGRGIARQHGGEAVIIKVFWRVIHTAMFGQARTPRHPLLAFT